MQVWFGGVGSGGDVCAIATSFGTIPNTAAIHTKKTANAALEPPAIKYLFHIENSKTETDQKITAAHSRKTPMQNKYMPPVAVPLFPTS